ncbi:hypothetical protein Gpo141_00006933 [Globisporangium polare]
MKLASIVLAAAAAVVAVSAQTATPAPATTAPVGAGTVSAAAGAEVPTTTAPAATPAAAAATAGSSSTGATAGDLLSTFKATATKDSYHMAPVRVVQARVQSDSPILVEGQLVSSFGSGKLDAGYLSSLDSVNTASVEGALMYVQAEAINIQNRDATQRCVRKTKVQNVVFYEILIAQTNETLAQFQADWSTPEYGPMIAMDGGRCTPTEGESTLPAECYQFNGENGQPNVGPFVGGTNKEESDRAPYPGNYWFSFPNSCPTQPWGKNKTDACRASTRKGLCPVGVAPNGVECTFAYNILGWVPIDDIVGITSFVNEATSKPYANFTEWCLASEKNVEFSYDMSTKTLVTSLPFWADPLSKDANKNRTQVMLDTYETLLTKGSTQVDPKVSAAFKAIPSPAELAKVNPPCYKTVSSCGSGVGCKRTGYSQLCTPCTAAEKCATTDGTFKFPKLEKAFTALPESQTKSVVSTSGSSAGNSTVGGKNGTSTVKSSASQVSFAFATVAASLIVSLAL